MQSGQINDQKGQKNQIIRSNKNENKVAQKQKQISKKKAKWVHFLILNNLNLDEKPIYIFYFRKCMKNYGNRQYNKYRTFGFEEAGIGRIEQLKLDKIYGNLEIQLETYQMGEISFKHLINLYKSYQDQQYYELALSLERYQEWSLKQLVFLNRLFTDMRKTLNFEQYIEKHLQNFDEDVTKWVSDKYKNEIYEVSIGYCDFENRLLALKKKIFSQNLIMFLGKDTNLFYNQIQKQNMKENMSYLFGGQEFNGKVQLEKMIKLLNCSTNGDSFCVIEDETITLEGIILPCTKTMTTYFYDEDKREITNQPSFFFFVVAEYNFEANWIKYLMDLRNNIDNQSNQKESQSKIVQQSNSMYSENLFTNFEFMCQQEYFLERFNYI